MKSAILSAVLFSCLSIFILPSFAVQNNAVIYPENEKKKPFLEERSAYLLNQFQIILKKAGWSPVLEGRHVKAFRLEDHRYDEISVRLDAGYSDNYYLFTILINKNGKQTSKTFWLQETVIKDDERFRDIVVSALMPAAVMREGVGDFRKAYSSIFSLGYARTHDGSEFYPAYAKGKLHLSWQLTYDPSANIFQKETPLTFGNYISFNLYFDWASHVHENFFNIDLLLFGKNKYSGTADHGTRLMYGLFSGLEYFRPGFSDSTMKWDREVYETEPYMQYMIWRVLQWNILISRRSGGSLYSAEFMAGAGMGVGPSSLSIAGTTEDEEQNMSSAFRSIKYRKQNYYFSYTLPARLSLCADHVFGFRFEAAYNYYFFYPIFTNDLYDMLHIAKGAIGYYLSYDVLLNVQYERWFIESMLNDKTKTHAWNRLIIELKNYF
ncbi:MAG: hypothetical protein V1874_12055 [Spirochaetota bacterium]